MIELTGRLDRRKPMCRSRAPAICAFVGASAAVLILGAFYLLRPHTCHGLPRDIGACDGDRPTYAGDNCQEVAKEWGSHFDERVAQVIAGPDTSGGKGRSSRLYEAETLVSQLANRHMRHEGIIAACARDEFLATGEAQHSASVREQVGATTELLIGDTGWTVP